MKRGKDEDKVTGPMFPRLHVNDTEKGGPRAPPRNKMALYEQLCIPSQRFKPGTVPTRTNSNPSTIPPASSSQGAAQERAVLFSLQLPNSRMSAEKVDSHYSDSNASLMQLEQKKKSEDDDFIVPIFMQSSMVQDTGRHNSNVDREINFPSLQASGLHSEKHVPASDSVPRRMPLCGHDLRQEDRSHKNVENRKDRIGSREQSVKTVPDSPCKRNDECVLSKNNTCLHHELGDSPVDTCSRSLGTENSLLPEHMVDQHPTCQVNDDAILNGPTRGKENGDSSVLMWDYQSAQRILDDTESREDKTYQSLPKTHADRDEDTSETSMVDCISGLDISPDDVVDIIGQRHFWKARRAIVTQQRLFAVQVFELHRLIKVQKLIAGSPHLLLESNSYLGKPRKASSPKKIPLEFIVKGPSNAAKPKKECEKLNNKMECSAENTVGKASLSSVQNGNQLPSLKLFSANSHAAAGDQTFGSWCFPQPQGHQWLVPVMTPSEGLVYKPHSGAGFMAPICGSCGPPGAVPMMGNFLTPVYGVPASHHYQGMGIPAFAAPAGPQGYFPPYGIPVLSQANSGPAVDQINQFAPSGFHGQLPAVAVNCNIQHQNSTNVSRQEKNRTDGVTPPGVMKIRASRDSELQGSTASSPSDKPRGHERVNSAGANVLTLFSTSPVIDVPDCTDLPPDADQSSRVIKVVPHNGRSATESVARIFQSIQEERKQYDSV